MKKTIVLWIALCLGLGASAQGVGDTIVLDNFKQKKMEKALFDKVNEYRGANQLPALRFNQVVYKVADDHLQYLKGQTELTHTQPDPAKKNSYERFKYYTKQSRAQVGENLVEIKVHMNLFIPADGPEKFKKVAVYTYEEAAEMMFSIWKSSDFHNQNMLSQKYSMGAMAIHLDPETKRMIAVHVFAKL